MPYQSEKSVLYWFRSSWSNFGTTTRKPRDGGSPKPYRAPVWRVSVVGTSGSGKSTLARLLADRLGVPWVELDAIFHQPGWQPLPAEQFRSRVAAAITGHGWVVDGNYSTVRELVWSRADTVIWFDLPRHTVMRQILWRTIRRAALRAELWNGNRERWVNVLSRDPQRSVVAWAWRTHQRNRHRYAAAASDPAWSHLRFVHVRSRAEVRRLLAGAVPG
jgi:adenylate kinase family enzyme